MIFDPWKSELAGLKRSIDSDGMQFAAQLAGGSTAEDDGFSALKRTWHDDRR
jgi:hypothetical protein